MFSGSLNLLHVLLNAAEWQHYLFETFHFVRFLRIYNVITHNTCVSAELGGRRCIAYNLWLTLTVYQHSDNPATRASHTPKLSVYIVWQWNIYTFQQALGCAVALDEWNSSTVTASNICRQNYGKHLLLYFRGQQRPQLLYCTLDTINIKLIV